MTGDDDLIDLHDHRDRLKLLKDAGDTALFQNRGWTCPVCGDDFARVLATEERSRSFAGGDPFCIVNEPGRVLLFAHE